MKPYSIKHFLVDNPTWITQFEQSDFLQNLLALCEQSGLYIVDNHQHVLFWSQQATQLTGWQPEHASAVLPFSELNIKQQSASREAIGIDKSEGSVANLLKNVRCLYDQKGAWVGGLGLLSPAEEVVSTQSGHAPVFSTRTDFQGILSRSPAMQDVFHIIQNAAETAATVLVRGESGAGKELVARAIHNLSARRAAPFLAINCAALSSNLLESELFGHVRGAFTGAVKDHAGLFQRAHGGTLFLDEVAELPLELQAKLLRVIQERNLIPVGGSHSIDVDVRLVAATHRSLREEVKAGRFREDLMYRLRVVPIFIPPLRDRREDISLLIWHFIQQHNAENFRTIERIEPQAMRVLLDYRWPGNIRELHNVVEYAFAVGRGTTLRLSELPPEFREPKAIESGLGKIRAAPLSAEEEKAAIAQALVEAHGNINHAAGLLGMSRATFWRKRRSYGLS